MKLFSQNLLNYENSNGLSVGDISDITGLNVETIESMEDGKFRLSDVSTLCTKLGLDFSSIYDNGGFKEVPAIDQYEAYPSELKRIVTRSFYPSICNQMKDICGENWCIPFHHTLDGRLRAGSACLTLENLHALQQYVKDYIDERKFYNELSETMYSKIANYNYIVAKDAFNVTYSDIGKAMGVSPSTASNWGGKWCVTIPEDRIDQFVKLAGGLNKIQFMTTPMSIKDMKEHECQIPTDRRRNGRKSKKSSEDFPEPPSTDVTNLEDHSVSVESNTVISVDADKALKLYQVLSASQKQQVNDLIFRLFFS